ncbi:hypothetical protein BS47DRAFT_1344943, partial [Hydnum rufescens UP504]
MAALHLQNQDNQDREWCYYPAFSPQPERHSPTEQRPCGRSKPLALGLVPAGLVGPLWSRLVIAGIAGPCRSMLLA